MPSYEWKGRDRSGVAQTGVLIGDSKDAVIAALRRRLSCANSAFSALSRRGLMSMIGTCPSWRECS